VAVGRANLVLVFCAVNIDESVAGVGVFGIKSVEPKDPRGHEIFRVGKRIVGTQCNARFEDCSRFGAAPDLLRDPKITEWRLVAAFFGANPEARTGDRKRANLLAVTSQGKELIFEGDVDLGSAALHG